MIVDQTKTFYVGGFPVTYSQIETWYDNYKSKLPKNSKCLPDPYYDEKVCWFIAAEIVKEIQKPLKQKIFDTRVVEDPQPLKSNKNAIKKADYWNDGCHVYEGNIVNGDTGDVIRKSLEALEKKYKEEAELLRKEREAEKLRQQTRTNVPPPIQQKPVEKPFEFRKILNIQKRAHGGAKK